MELAINILLAFAGGLILNFMPCVLPVILLKVNSLISRGNNIAETFKYCAGIITTFVLMGLSISALNASGYLVSWGFHMQSPYVMLGLGIIFGILGACYLNLIDFGTYASGFFGGLFNRVSSFVNGMFAVLAAAPCTGPLLGGVIALAVASNNSYLYTLSVFTSMGLGMSFPYLLLGTLPQTRKLLPRPGKWMVYLKTVTGMGMIVVSVWFASMSPGNNSVPSDWQEFSVSKYEAAKAENKKIFVYITAEWCAICKVNERVLFSDKMKELFKRNGVVLYYGDYTRLNPEISDFLLKMGHSGVPLYVVFNGKEYKGSQILNYEEIERYLNEDI